jgi:hypothetical protein
MSGYYYRQTETNLWTVGRDFADGTWSSYSDHPTEDEAAARVHYLNGGSDKSPSTCFSTRQPEPMGSPLIRLCNGAWVDPANVRGIHVIEQSDYEPIARVRVFGPGISARFEVDGGTDATAYEIADRFAGLINAARRGDGA